MFGLISGALGVASGIKGLFSSNKPKERTPRDGILSQAQGAREASDKYGFNPLTMLQAGAGHGFSQTQGGPPPLASIQAITDGLMGIDDIMSGDQARRRAADQAELDLAHIRIDEAKRGVGYSQPRNSPVSLGPVTGNRASTVVQTSVRPVPAKFSVGENIIAPGRKDDVAPLTNSPGVFEIENAMTGGRPITVPGEGEPLGIDELIALGIIGAPQAIGNLANRWVFGGKKAWEWAEENKARERKLSDDDLSSQNRAGNR